jgi:hypothetical protein
MRCLRLLLVVIAGLVGFVLTTSSASAVQQFIPITTSPVQPEPGVPFTVTAHPNGVVGTAYYSWNLTSESGPCTTAPSTNPSITVTAPAGYFNLTVCVQDAGPVSEHCGHQFLVGALPTYTLSAPPTTESSFIQHGMTLTANWDTAVDATYTVNYAVTVNDTTTSGGPQLLAPITIDGATAQLHIPPPPPNVVAPPGEKFPAIVVTASIPFWQSSEEQDFPLATGTAAQLDPCIAAYPSPPLPTKLPGGRLVYSRARSLQMVCQGFGTDTGGLNIDWLTPGMACAVVAAGLGAAQYESASLFVDGACSGADLALHPGVVSVLETACSTASDLLGIPEPVIGRISGLACAAAPVVGQGLGTWLETHHEYDVARKVMHTHDCIEWRDSGGIVSWHAVACR